MAQWKKVRGRWIATDAHGWIKVDGHWVRQPLKERTELDDAQRAELIGRGIARKAGIKRARAANETRDVG